MNKIKQRSLLFYFVAPFVLLLTITSIVLAGQAALENYHITAVSDQLIVIVVRARELKISSSMTAQKAQVALVEQLVGFDRMEPMSVPVSSQNGTYERGVASPWAGLIRLFAYPQARAMRMEVPLSASACRRVLTFYSEDVFDLGLQRIDIRDNLPSALWRLVYEQPKGAKNGVLTTKAIEAGCGETGSIVASMTFSL